MQRSRTGRLLQPRLSTVGAGQQYVPGRFTLHPKILAKLQDTADHFGCTVSFAADIAFAEVLGVDLGFTLEPKQNGHAKRRR